MHRHRGNLNHEGSSTSIQGQHLHSPFRRMGSTTLHPSTCPWGRQKAVLQPCDLQPSSSMSVTHLCDDSRDGNDELVLHSSTSLCGLAAPQNGECSEVHAPHLRNTSGGLHGQVGRRIRRADRRDGKDHRRIHAARRSARHSGGHAIVHVFHDGCVDHYHDVSYRNRDGDCDVPCRDARCYGHHECARGGHRVMPEECRARQQSDDQLRL